MRAEVVERLLPRPTVDSQLINDSLLIRLNELVYDIKACLIISLTNASGKTEVGKRGGDTVAIKIQVFKMKAVESGEKVV